MRFWRDESGQAMVMTLVSMGILLGFLALAVDVGLLFKTRRALQMVADAAATAGALDYYYTGSPTSAQAAATAAATANGVSTGTVLGLTTTVTPKYPVNSGAHTGPGVVEVDIAQQEQTSLMGYFGFPVINVAVKAVAAPVNNHECIYLMGYPGLSSMGNATIEARDPNTGQPGCGIYVGSNVDIKGGNTFDIAYVAASGQLVGGAEESPAPLIQNAPTQKIPKALNIVPPNPANMTCTAPTGGTTTVGGITYNVVSGPVTPPSGGICYSGNVMLAGTPGTPLVLYPGLYVFSGTNVAVGDNVTGNGLTLDVYNGTFTLTSTTNVSLSAPTDGASDPYNGILLLEPATNTNSINIQWGAASGTFAGIIDAYGANVTLQDQGGSALVTGLVANRLTLPSNETLTVVDYGAVHSNSPLNSIELVE